MLKTIFKACNVAFLCLKVKWRYVVNIYIYIYIFTGNTKPCTRCVKSKDKSGTNIILLAAHGGVSRPDDMTDRPDRGCYDSATGTCTYTLNCTTDDESK